VAHIAIKEVGGVENFLISGRRQLMLMDVVQTTLRTLDIVAAPEVHTAERVTVTVNPFRGDFQLLARFDLDADLMDLALPDFIVQLFRLRITGEVITSSEKSWKCRTRPPT
jgi:hypothetical protein